nr:hypothetical protein [Pseudomonas sp.]
MPYTPPFRTRRGTQPQIEPHLGDPDTDVDTPESKLTWTTASDRPLADDPIAAHRPVQDDDDDALPVLTQLVEPPAVTSFEPAAEPLEEPFDEGIDEQVDEQGDASIDEELVARITDDVLDAIQPTLHELVADAIRRALKDHARHNGL